MVRGSEKDPEGYDTKGGGNARVGLFANIEYAVSRYQGDLLANFGNGDSFGSVFRPSEIR